MTPVVLADWERCGPEDAPYFTLGHPTSAGDLQRLVAAYGPRNKKPLSRCLECVAAAKTVVIEHNYIDNDYLSEHAYLDAREFLDRPRRTDRLHFFADKLTNSDILNLYLRYAGSDAKGRSLLETCPFYLGYCIVRPRPTGTVGRTMLRPPADLADYVRTATTETISLFGQPLRIKAVPFMEQDETTARCAHAVGWMCHYTAALREIVGRRLTVDFHEAAVQSPWSGRSFPSGGLSRLQLVNVLDTVELPALVFDVLKFGADKRDWRPVWNHRKDFIELVRNSGTDERSAACAWFHEVFSSESCRYLNSGFPVALSEGEHIFVVCGYVRGQVGGYRPLTEFICHDDVVGPYIRKPVPTLRVTTDGERMCEYDDLFVPLPNGVWLTGQAAETWARRVISRLIERVREMVREDRTDFAWEKVLATLDPFDNQRRDNRFALRTYAIPAGVFKVAFSASCAADPVAVREVRQLNLPRHIWVVEVMDRELRDKGDTPAVLGEVILDATSHDKQPVVRAVRLPGVIAFVQDNQAPHAARDEGAAMDAAYFVECGAVARHTTRPSYGFAGPELSGQSKLAARGAHV